MKKLYASICALVLIANTVDAQQKHERCGFNHVVDYYETLNPGYKSLVKETYDQSLINIENKISRRAEEVYEIPVVIHVVYSDSVQNIPDSVIYDQIRVLNEDFMRLNPDTVNLRDTFLTVVGTPRVKFRLASYDPNGNPTTGITRTETTELFGEGGGFFGPDIAEIEDVKITANGGQDPWDQTKYLNIWICDMAAGGDPSLLGYATPPANLDNWPAGSTDGMSDGIVIQYQCIGSNNPNELNVPGMGVSTVLGRTVTHEVGHYLGLRHTAEQSWFGGSCGDDDGLNNTPNCEQSQFDCNTVRNSCVDTVINIHGDTLWNLPDMVENFMDYSEETCQNSFTFGQADIIRDVMLNHRNGLVNNGKLSGINDNSTSTFLTSIYPNPSSGFFQVDFLGNNIEQVFVYNELGQLIIQKLTNAMNMISIDMSEYDRGVYYLKLQGENLNKVEKLIIK